MPSQSVIPIMKPFLGVAEQEAAAAAIASGWIAQGPRVAEFENAFSTHLGATRSVAVSSCTTGLHLALYVLGIGAATAPGSATDEVIVPSLSFIATANSARYVGATPVFADVDPITQNLTAATVAAAITPRTRAVIVVHQGGMPADVDAIAAVCGGADIALVEDAACAIGSTYRDRPVAADAAMGVFSFHPRKILTTGEGGMFVTSDESVAARVTRLREHGMSMSAAQRHGAGAPTIEQYLETGFNFRMTDIQAAVGLVQLAKLDEMITRRRELADRYAKLLCDIDGIQLPSDPEWGTTNYQSYCVLLAEDSAISRNDLMAALHDEGISTRRGIMASHLEPAYDGHRHDPLPVTERLTADTIILPLFHQMGEDEQDRVADALHRYLANPGEVGG